MRPGFAAQRNHLPADLSVELQQYFQHKRAVDSKHCSRALLQQMSPYLRAEVRLASCAAGVALRPLLSVRHLTMREAGALLQQMNPYLRAEVGDLLWWCSFLQPLAASAYSARCPSAPCLFAPNATIRLGSCTHTFATSPDLIKRFGHLCRGPAGGQADQLPMDCRKPLLC